MGNRKKGKRSTGHSQLPDPFKTVLKSAADSRAYLKTFAQAALVGSRRVLETGDKDKIERVTEITTVIRDDIARYNQQLDDVEQKIKASKQHHSRDIQKIESLGRSGEIVTIVDSMNSTLIPLSQDLMTIVRQEQNGHNKPAEIQE